MYITCTCTVHVHVHVQWYVCMYMYMYMYMYVCMYMYMCELTCSTTPKRNQFVTQIHVLRNSHDIASRNTRESRNRVLYCSETRCCETSPSAKPCDEPVRRF